MYYGHIKEPDDRFSRNLTGTQQSVYVKNKRVCPL